MTQHQLDNVALGSGVKCICWAFGSAGIEAAEAAVHGSGDNVPPRRSEASIREDVCTAFVRRTGRRGDAGGAGADHGDVILVPKIHGPAGLSCCR